LEKMEKREKNVLLIGFGFFALYRIAEYVKAFLDIEVYKEIYMKNTPMPVTILLLILSMSCLLTFSKRDYLAQLSASKDKKHSVEYYKFLFTLTGLVFPLLGLVHLFYVLYIYNI